MTQTKDKQKRQLPPPGPKTSVKESMPEISEKYADALIRLAK